jgi:hypothetical protein
MGRGGRCQRHISRRKGPSTLLHTGSLDVGRARAAFDERRVHAMS